MKYKFSSIAYLILFAVNSSLTAQTADSLINKITDGFENQIEAAGEISEDSDLIESVELLSENPVNLNTASLSELQQIPRVDPVIAQKIIEFRIENSGFKSFSDLQKIPEISDDLYRSMLPFIRIKLNRSYSGIGENFSGNRNDKAISENPISFMLRQRTAFDFQEKKAFREKKYEGNKYKIYNRLKTSYLNYSAGIIADKDPGESNYSDYLNGYFQISEINLPFDFKINRVVAGAYQASYGQGLIQWTNSGFGKSASTVLSAKRNERGIQPFLSSDENQYFTGAGVSVYNNAISASTDVFYSSRTLDGKITETEFYTQDNSNDDLISYTLDNSGYHRDSSETAKKDQIRLSTVGFNLTRRFDNFGRIGFTGIFTTVHNSPVFTYQSGKPEIEEFYSRTPRKNSSYSVNFDFVFNSISIYGETAVHNNVSYAISSGLIFRPAKQIAYTIHFRKMDPGFLPVSGKPFSEKTSSSGNETGIYHGLEYKSGNLKLNLYYDNYRFPWSTFQNPYPRYGTDWLLFSEYTLNKNASLNFQYKNEKAMETLSSKDEYGRETILSGETKSQNMKLQLTTGINTRIKLKSRIDYTFYTGTGSITTSGFALVEQLKYNVNESGYFILQYQYFDSPAYNNRVYIYENDLPGLLTSVSLYGKGTRYSVSSTMELFSSLSISAKLAITKYSDRKTISSGDSEIQGNMLSQLGIQLDWDF